MARRKVGTSRDTSRQEPRGDLRDAFRGVRIQKVLAAAGIAARREAETLVTAGRVTVNGQVVAALPAWVDPATDRIEVDGQPLPRSRRAAASAAAPDKPRDAVYIALHKPRRVISSARDPEGRRTVVDLLPDEVLRGRRVYPVGRLDAESTGLILLTNDGELTQHLTHPSYEVPKRYHVSVRGRLTSEDVETLKKGLYLADKRRLRQVSRKHGAASKAAMSAVRLLGYEKDRARGDRTTLEVTLREGRNREIRRMLARLDMKVRRLQRVAIGSLTLKGLAVGQWRVLSSAEVRSLRKAAGLA